MCYQRIINLRRSEQETDRFHHFLTACCELNPGAWSRSSELWQVYERWVEMQQVPFSLSRRAFADQLRAQGCCAERTNTMRLWRGIRVLKKAL